MPAKQRGPGDRNTEAPKQNAPIKSKPNNSQAHRKVQRRKPAPAKNRMSTRREYVVYDGRRFLGCFIFNETTKQALAWNASRRFIGRIDGYRAAARAISRAVVTKLQAIKARRRLDDPRPEFVTGLPEHFLRAGR
jgi:hypothetical protein